MAPLLTSAGAPAMAAMAAVPAGVPAGVPAAVLAEVGHPHIGGVGVAASLVLIVVAAAVSWRERLGLERSIAWAATRAAVQLGVIGAGLGLVLADDAPLVWSILWVVAMVVIGGVTVGRRVPAVPGLTVVATAALGGALAVSLAVVFGFGMFELEPRTLVPSAGMLLGNGIGATVLAARRTLLELDDHRAEIEVRLSLGLTGPAAVRPHVREALRTAVTPQIEQTKIVGLIALPGTMTGLLLAGVDPLDAVAVQGAVMFLILGSVAITGVVVGRGVAHRLLTPDHRLVLPPAPVSPAG
jgi:putative ABC transport system permease protein